MSRSLLLRVGLCALIGGAGRSPHPPAQLASLPLVEARAANPTGTLAVVLSGDGDWATLVKTVTLVLNEQGISVVGLKVRSYLQGHQRTPESAARDLDAILRSYCQAWGADSVLIVGYSRGAELAPFMVSRLTAELRDRVQLLALIGPAPNASFSFHLDDLIANKHRPTDLPTGPEVEKLRGLRMLCIYGTDEPESLCRDVDSTLMRSVARRGGHHLDRDYRALGELIVQERLPVTHRGRL